MSNQIFIKAKLIAGFVTSEHSSLVYIYTIQNKQV